jgi:hypothetical protein
MFLSLTDFLFFQQDILEKHEKNLQIFHVQDIEILSNLSYVTFQGKSDILSHKTGAHLL